MLRRLNVRARLIAVLAVPLVLLLAVAGPEFLQRQDAAHAADSAADLTGAATQLSAAVESLQAERTHSAAVRAGAGDQLRADLRELRAVTDVAVEEARGALRQVEATDPTLADHVGAATQALDGLDAVREETDLSDSIVPWVDPFAPVLGALLDVQEDLGSAVADAGVGGELTEVALLARSKEAAAGQAAQVAAATVWGELRGDQVGILTGLRADEQAFRTAYLAAAPAAVRVERRAEVAAGAATSAARVVDSAVRDASAEPARSLGSWLELSAARQSVLRSVEEARAAEALDVARDAGDAARRAATAYLALAGAGLVLAVGLALLAARSITRPLRYLTEAADHLAEERLPKLVDALRRPGNEDERYLAATVKPIEVHSDDELGHLAKAFNTVQAVAVDVAAEQAELLRKGISDLYVNLARRNQSLLERQIQLLTRVEAGEQDPAVLEHLYSLDHLATRMRRNAESLLVLAGEDSGPRRSRPVSAVDMVRAALSEVEEYGRIELGALADAVVHGPAVADVAHIVAELLENATSFSPPDTMVRVDGSRTGASYQLVITDRGVGMPEEQLDDLNAILRDPPVTGLALGRSLGCLVAARLAARHDISVRLSAPDGGGVAATVVLPRRLLVGEDGTPSVAPVVYTPAVADDVLFRPEPEVPRRADESEGEPVAVGPPVAEAPAPEPLMPVAANPAVEPAVEPVAPATVSEDRDDWLFDWGRDPEPSPPAPPIGRPVPAHMAGRAAPPPAAQLVDAVERPARLRDAIPAAAAFDAGLDAILEHTAPAPSMEPPVTGGATASGLQRRVPGASGGVESNGPALSRSKRSPDEIRALLSRYRTGMRAGRDADGNPQKEPS